MQIREHILIHGNLTKTVTVKVAGDEMEVEEFVDAEEEGAVNKGTQNLANRESFLVMRDRLKAQVRLHCWAGVTMMIPRMKMKRCTHACTPACVYGCMHGSMPNTWR